MAPEKETKEGMLSRMTTRQKMIAVVLVIILLVIIWQIMGLFEGGGGTATPTIAEITPPAKAPAGGMTANTPAGTAGTPATPAGGTPPGAAPGQVVTQTGEPVPIREAPVTMDNQIIDLQKKTEQKYLDQLNQLQMLRIQREIAETNQAIASARLATVTAEKNVSDLLTKPTQPPVPTGPQNALLLNQIPGELIPPPEQHAPAPTPPPPPPILEIPYNVISVSMQLGRWTAVLSFQGKLYNVMIGDKLPLDGSVVVDINRNSVLLIKEKKRRRISIISSI